MSGDDIVARLRACKTGDVPVELLDRAAGEIETLRAVAADRKRVIAELFATIKRIYEESVLA